MQWLGFLKIIGGLFIRLMDYFKERRIRSDERRKINDEQENYDREVEEIIVSIDGDNPPKPVRKYSKGKK